MFKLSERMKYRVGDLVIANLPDGIAEFAAYRGRLCIISMIKGTLGKTYTVVFDDQSTIEMTINWLAPAPK